MAKECTHPTLDYILNEKTGVHTYVCQTPGCGYWSTYDSSRNLLARYKPVSSELKPGLKLSTGGKH